jgi:hypothetical protein
MPFVLTTSSDVHCPTSGTVTPGGKPKLTVAGAAVTTPADITGKSVSGCKTPTSNSTKPCTKVASATGAATKLTVGGTGVALDSLTGATDGTTPKLAASAGQSKLKAV